MEHRVEVMDVEVGRSYGETALEGAGHTAHIWIKSQMDRVKENLPYL